jgi:hypothetical protein
MFARRVVRKVGKDIHMHPQFHTAGQCSRTGLPGTVEDEHMDTRKCVPINLRLGSGRLQTQGFYGVLGRWW